MLDTVKAAFVVIAQFACLVENDIVHQISGIVFVVIFLDEITSESFDSLSLVQRIERLGFVELVVIA